eukprot:2524887-Pleurochrysis_carterae.AAC.2
MLPRDDSGRDESARSCACYRRSAPVHPLQWRPRSLSFLRNACTALLSEAVGGPLGCFCMPPEPPCCRLSLRRMAVSLRCMWKLELKLVGMLIFTCNTVPA